MAICSERIVAYADVGAGVGLGDDEGGYVLSLRNSLGAVEKAVIGGAAGTNEVWALTSEGAVVRVRDTLLAVCRESQQTLEDTRVFPVAAAAVTSISVSEGYPAYMLSRKTATDPWRLVSPVDAPADVDYVEKMLSAGADKVSINSAALRNPALIDEIAYNFGSQVCVVAIDARLDENGWTCYLNGGRIPTERGLFDWAREANERGAGEILFTSMNHDGVKAGFALREVVLRVAHQCLDVAFEESLGIHRAIDHGGGMQPSHRR